MPQLYLILNNNFIGIAFSSTNLSLNTCINKAGRQELQLRSVKSVFLRIQLRYRYEILYDVF